VDSATYFDVFVVANFRAYLSAEENLTRAIQGGDADQESARRQALSAGMNAAVAAYHFADALHEDRPSWLASAPANLADLRRDMETRHCQMMRNTTPVADLTALGAVVDAYKHFELRSKTRPVKSIDATITIATGWGELAWGEGKYGGVEQVIVHLSDGTKRALSSILQNVVDMWRRAMGRPLEPIGS
jgi:hypothetical protein